MPQSPTYGYEAFKKVTQDIKNKRSPTKKSINDMDLKELLILEERFNEWYPTHPDHPERKIKLHIYKKYIQPRIKELQECEKLSIHAKKVLIDSFASG